MRPTDRKPPGAAPPGQIPSIAAQSADAAAQSAAQPDCAAPDLHGPQLGTFGEQASGPQSVSSLSAASASPNLPERPPETITSRAAFSAPQADATPSTAEQGVAHNMDVPQDALGTPTSIPQSISGQPAARDMYVAPADAPGALTSGPQQAVSKPFAVRAAPGAPEQQPESVSEPSPRFAEQASAAPITPAPQSAARPSGMAAQPDALFRIAPPGKGRPADAVAGEILSLCRGDFSLTLTQLCRLFCCERQWAAETFLPAVRHITLTSFFHRYILERPWLTAGDRALMAQGLYFFSRADLARFWAENAAAKRKTAVIDLAPYVREGVAPAALSAAGGRKQALLPLLTEEGRRIAAAPPEWRPAALPPWNAGYVSAAQIQRRQDLRSNTAAYRYLFDRGAIHVQLRGKVLWHIPDAFCRVPFAAACPPV